jgi:hypothetical protein
MSVCRYGLIACLIFAGNATPLFADVASESHVKDSGTAKISEQSQQSIDRGTRWLMSAMRADGSFGTDIGHPEDLGCTAIVGLALLSQGSCPTGGEHRDEVVHILNAILDIMDRFPDGVIPRRETTLVQRKIGANADIFLAALFLSQIRGEAAAAEGDVARALKKCVWIICQTQGKEGTWGTESWAPVLGTVLGWESLRVSNSAGLEVKASAKSAGDALLQQLREKSSNDEGSWMHSLYKDAASVRVLYSLNYRNDPVFQNCVNRIIRIAREDARPFERAGEEEYLAFYFVTECLLNDQQDPQWQEWYPTVEKRIVKMQNTDGSWTGHHCITARTFCTAAALLTLQSPNLFLPSSNL